MSYYEHRIDYNPNSDFEYTDSDYQELLSYFHKILEATQFYDPYEETIIQYFPQFQEILNLLQQKEMLFEVTDHLYNKISENKQEEQFLNDFKSKLNPEQLSEWESKEQKMLEKIHPEEPYIPRAKRWRYADD